MQNSLEDFKNMPYDKQVISGLCEVLEFWMPDIQKAVQARANPKEQLTYEKVLIMIEKVKK